MNDWKKLADELKAIPVERQILRTRYYEELTSDTGVTCGCAAGQIMFNRGLGNSELLCEFLHIQDDSLQSLFVINDEFRPLDDTEESCRARYAHVLAECERRSMSDE